MNKDSQFTNATETATRIVIECAFASESTIAVAIIYEAKSAALRARALFDGVSRQLDECGSFEIEYLKTDFFRDPGLRPRIARQFQAGTSSQVVSEAPMARELPNHVNCCKPPSVSSIDDAQKISRWAVKRNLVRKEFMKRAFPSPNEGCYHQISHG